MKKILFLLIGFAIVVSVKAQEIPERKMEKSGMHHGMHERGMKGFHDRMKMMAKDLNLSEQQKDQLKKNREDLHTRIKMIREDNSLSDEKKKDAIQAEMKGQKDKTNSILTEEQKKKMKEMHKRDGDFKGRKPDDKKVI